MEVKSDRKRGNHTQTTYKLSSGRTGSYGYRVCVCVDMACVVTSRLSFYPIFVHLCTQGVRVINVYVCAGVTPVHAAIQPLASSCHVHMKNDLSNSSHLSGFEGESIHQAEPFVVPGLLVPLQSLFSERPSQF